LFVCFWYNSPQWARASSFMRFLNHTQHTTVSRTLDEWSAHHRDLFVTTHNTHNRQASMPLVGFKPTVSADEQPQTYTLDHAANETGIFRTYRLKCQLRDHLSLTLFFLISPSWGIYGSILWMFFHFISSHSVTLSFDTSYSLPLNEHY
jgi:hypothetical protein